MLFTQIIEIRTDHIDELRALDEEYLERMSPEERKTFFRRGQTAVDREDPQHFFTILEYESYEAMLATMSTPGSHEIAAAIAPLIIGEPIFRSGNVIHRETFPARPKENMFTQIIEVRTNNIEELTRIDNEYLAQMSDHDKAFLFGTGHTVADRDDSERFFTILEYDAYETMVATMTSKSSADVSAAIAPLVIGEPKFWNCDVIHREVREG